MQPVRVLVGGAGMAGLGAAVLLGRLGVDCEVYESSPCPGGLVLPVEFLGLRLDRGSHRVHADANDVLFDLTEGAAWDRQRRRGILVLGGRHLPYPLEPLAFARALGIRSTSELVVGWLFGRNNKFARFQSWDRDRATCSPDEGFEDFVLARAGPCAYERFYRPYVEKVWGVEPSRLSQTVARQRLSTSSPWRAMLAPLGFQRARSTFLYPRHGVAALVDVLVDRCQRLGVRIHHGRTIDLEALRAVPHDYVIHTGALISLVPGAQISHRGVYLLHMAFEPGVLRDVDTWYVPESHYWFGRVSQPARFSPALGSRLASVLAVEIPEGRWGLEVDFASKVGELTAQLHDAGILDKRVAPTEIRQTFVPRVYPMYLRGWRAQWQQAIDEVRPLRRVLPAGRQGLFLHCNMDQALRTAADAVEHVWRGGSAEAWLDTCSRYLDLQVRD
jgi:UDP-galactopyranose mutase